MAGHFGAIGFPVTTREELEALAVLAANVGEAHEVADSMYVRWQAGSGVEVWAHAEKGTQKIRGVTPYFASGKAAVSGIVEEVLKGAVSFVPTGDERRAALAGVLVAVPDLGALTIAPKTPLRMSAAAFAHAFEELDSERALGTSGLTLGMMLPAAQGLSLVAGRVLESGLRTNPSGRRDFGWVLLEVQGGSIDVLLDPELRDDVPSPGTICRGVFWLAGRPTA